MTLSTVFRQLIDYEFYDCKIFKDMPFGLNLSDGEESILLFDCLEGKELLKIKSNLVYLEKDDSEEDAIEMGLRNAFLLLSDYSIISMSIDVQPDPESRYETYTYDCASVYNKFTENLTKDCKELLIELIELQTEDYKFTDLLKIYNPQSVIDNVVHEYGESSITLDKKGKVSIKDGEELSTYEMNYELSNNQLQLFKLILMSLSTIEDAKFKVIHNLTIMKM